MNTNHADDDASGGGNQAGIPAPEAITVASLAQRLHEQNGEPLEIAVPDGVVLNLGTVPGVAVVDGALRFGSLADRNRIVADAALVELGDKALEPTLLFQAATRLWRHEIGHEDSACGRLLAAVHPRSNVLAMAAEELGGPSDVFQLLNLLGKMLPHADTLDWGSLISVTEAQFPRTRGDGAAGVFFEHLRRWLVAHPGSGAELTAVLLLAPGEPIASLLHAALLAWGADDPVRAAVKVGELAERKEAPLPTVSGLVAGGMLADVTLPNEAVAPLEALVHRRLAGTTPEERRIGVLAATNVLHLRSTFDAPLRTLARAGDPDALGFIAFAIGLHTKALLESGSFFEWLDLCAAIPVSLGGAIGQLDTALSRYLGPQSQHREAVLGFLQAWITAQPPQERAGRAFAKLFNSCADGILRDEALLRRVLTTWFLADARGMPEAAASLITGLSSDARIHRGHTDVDKVGFDPVVLEDVSTADLLFLARRVIGYVINADLQLALALSLLEVKDAKLRVHPFMASLLGDEIGYDYPGTTTKRLSAAIDAESDADTKALLERIRDGLQGYLSQLDALPRLRELATPQGLQRAFRKVRAKQMDQGMREARRESVFSQLVNQVQLKGGLSSFHYVNNSFTEPMVLRPLSYSFELPRREALDPVGNAHRLHVNRTAKKEAK